MSEQDDKLAKRLQSLEEGKSLEHVLEDNDNSEELSSLVNLAASIRELHHPELDSQAIQSEKHKIISMTQARNRANQRRQGSKVGGFTGQWLFVPAAAGLALILLMAFILAVGSGIYVAGPRGAHTATLTEAQGVLEVSDSGADGDWQAVSNGDKVRSGQRIRTRADSWVTIAFFDGTQTTLSPNTDLMLDKIDGDWGNVLQVVLVQNMGESEHGVVPLQGKNAAFDVYTPSGTATVKGTKFRVLVNESGKSTFKVDNGKVLVTNDDSQVYVGAGQGLATELGEPLSTPGYLFVLQGELSAQVDNIWTVAGVNIIIPEEVQNIGHVELLENVFVQGQIQDQFDWVAESIQPALTDDQTGAFTGFVSVVSEDQLTWQVNGIDFKIDGEAQVDEGIEDGDAVRVAFDVLEGGDWRVTRIDSLEEDEEDGDSGDLGPDADSAADGEELPGVTCTGADPHPKADKLLVDYPDAAVSDETETSRSVTYDDIMGWFCNDKLGFGEIELAFKLSASSELLVDQIIELRLGGLGWGQIKQDLADLADDDGAPDEEPSDDGEEEPDDGEEEPDEGEEEPDEGEEETPDDDGDRCTGTREHPKASKLEADYAGVEGVDVTAGDIMGWFCDLHFGFGEIDLMLGLSAQYGKDIDEIITMRLGGLGWGQIKKDLADDAGPVEEYLNPAGKAPPGKNKDKPNKKDDD
jgi:hypothetical protein